MATSPGTGRDIDLGTDTASREGRFDRSTGGRRRSTERLSTETKHSSKTTELYIYLVATIGVLIAGLVTKAGDGHDDRLTAKDTWIIVGILTAAYLVSRGLAKAGSRDPYWADRGDRDPSR